MQSTSFSSCSWGSQGKNTEVVCLSLLQWTTFCQNSPSWPIHLGWPYMAWLIVSLSQTRLWSMWSVSLVFCDCAFPSVCPLMDKDKRFMEVSWWWESQFLCRLIRSLGVPKERGVWNSQGEGKDKLFFPLHSLGLYNNNVSCLKTVSGKKPSGNPVILKCKLWEWV